MKISKINQSNFSIKI